MTFNWANTKGVKHNNGQLSIRGQNVSFLDVPRRNSSMFARNDPGKKWLWTVCRVCEWKSLWQLTTVGQHVESKKWQNVTSVLPCSFNFKTKRPFKVYLCEWVYFCLRLSLPVFSSYFGWHQINQIAFYYYGNHSCQSKIIIITKKKESVSQTQNTSVMVDWSITWNWFAMRDVAGAQWFVSISGNRCCW